MATGYSVPRIISGCWQLSSGHRRQGDADAAATIDALDRRADAGFTAFDCADIYTGVESLLGRLLRRRRRAGASAIEVHTKLVPDLAALPRLDRRHVQGIVDRALSRLGVERLDLLQLHWWDFAIAGWPQAAAWLDELRRAGKIRHIGVTNFDSGHLEPVLASGVPVVSNQVQYSLLDRRPRSALSDQASAASYRLLAYGTLAGGFLCRHWLGQPPPTAPLNNRSLVKYRLIIEEVGGWEALQALLQAIDRVARRRGVPFEAVPTAWTLAQPQVAAAIVGVRDDRHLDCHRLAATLELDAEDHRLLNGALDQLRDLPGDVYSLERQVGGRHAVIMKTDLNRLADPPAVGVGRSADA